MPTKEDPDRWARLRFAIIGPLLAAPPPMGTLRGELEALAQKTGVTRSTGQPFVLASPPWSVGTMPRVIPKTRSSRCVVMHVTMPVLSGNSPRR